MDNFKKIGKKIADFLGVFIPNITFLVIFLTFMVTIVSRYFFKTPVTWSYEVSVLGYMWTMFFGVGKAMEADETRSIWSGLRCCKTSYPVYF